MERRVVREGERYRQAAPERGEEEERGCERADAAEAPLAPKFDVLARERDEHGCCEGGEDDDVWERHSTRTVLPPTGVRGTPSNE